MIEKLRGRCIHKLPNRLIIDVNGVGYSVEVPLPFIQSIGEGTPDLNLWIYTHIREDVLKLYGFPTYNEKVAFTVLLSLSGVGPKLALAILSALTLKELINAVMSRDESQLTSVPGIGARTAEKLMVELKSKLDKLDKEFMTGMVTSVSGLANAERTSPFPARETGFDAFQFELLSALENLGFKAAQVKPILQMICKEDEKADFSQVLKRVLSKLADHKSLINKTASPLPLGDVTPHITSSRDMRDLF